MKYTDREIQRLEAHLKTAKAYAELSYAQRLKVGAVLIKDDRIISIGYNGMPSGIDNTCEDVVKRQKVTPTKRINVLTQMPIHKTEEYEELVTKPGLVHAEMNVIAFAAKNGMSTDQCIMIVTHAPCHECSKLIIQSGIKKVIYETEYRLRDGIDFLEECGVKVERFQNAKEENRSSTAAGGREENI